MTQTTLTRPTAVHVEVVAAFTKDGEGGNPAGVAVDARGLSSALRQRIAASVGAPETAFVEREPDHL